MGEGGGGYMDAWEMCYGCAGDVRVRFLRSEYEQRACAVAIGPVKADGGGRRLWLSGMGWEMYFLTAITMIQA